MPALVARLAERAVRPTRLMSRTATLDDVFLSLTGRTLREDMTREANACCRCGRCRRRAITQFLREPGAVFWTFGFPLLITVALGIAFRDQSPPPSRVAIVAGGGSAAVAEAVKGAPGLAVESDDAATAARRLRSGDVAAGDRRRPPAGPSCIASIRRAPMRRRRGGWSTTPCKARGRRDPIATREETAVARGARYVDWLIPGLLGMQLLNGSDVGRGVRHRDIAPAQAAQAAGGDADAARRTSCCRSASPG